MIKWPKSNGAPSFKLEHINEMNDLATGQAHDVGDVSVCVELGKGYSHIRNLARGFVCIKSAVFPEKLHIMLIQGLICKRFGSIV